MFKYNSAGIIRGANRIECMQLRSPYFLTFFLLKEKEKPILSNRFKEINNRHFGGTSSSPIYYAADNNGHREQSKIGKKNCDFHEPHFSVRSGDFKDRTVPRISAKNRNRTEPTVAFSSD